MGLGSRVNEFVVRALDAVGLAATGRCWRGAAALSPDTPVGTHATLAMLNGVPVSVIRDGATMDTLGARLDFYWPGKIALLESADLTTGRCQQIHFASRWLHHLRHGGGGGGVGGGGGGGRVVSCARWRRVRRGAVAGAGGRRRSRRRRALARRLRACHPQRGGAGVAEIGGVAAQRMRLPMPRAGHTLPSPGGRGAPRRGRRRRRRRRRSSSRSERWHGRRVGTKGTADGASHVRRRISKPHSLSWMESCDWRATSARS